MAVTLAAVITGVRLQLQAGIWQLAYVEFVRPGRAVGDGFMMIFVALAAVQNTCRFDRGKAELQ